MKRYFSLIGLLLLSVAVIFTGCSKEDGGAKSSDGGGDKKLKVVYYVNGTLGDKGFFDSAKAGLDKAEKELSVEVKTIEGGNNQADWPAGLESLAADGKYDVIIVGTSQMLDITIDVAKRYPEENFILFDEVVSDVPNIYSMLYSQSEGSFLVGAFGALVTTSTELKGANPEKVIGFIGGMDIPIINDFKAGYEQGAQYVDPDVKIIASYVGDFANAPKAKELALAQYNSQNVDISFNVAGGAGLGLLEAGKEVGKYSIGVDGNQNPLYPGSVLTSMLKNIDQSIYRALELHLKGELKYGTNEVLGLKEGGIGLAKDDLYEKHVPQSIKDKMKEIEEELRKGEIKVESIL
jgi:basic membrane protein A